MDNNQLHKQLESVYNKLLCDQLSDATKSLFSVLKQLRPELYEVNDDSFSYIPEFFSLKEFEVSSTAEKYHLKNTIPNDVVKSNLLNLCRVILDPARRLLSSPIFVSSGYRSQTLNKLVGGVPNSRHLSGMAADVSCCDNDRLYNILNSLPHSELIYHSPHYIHVAL